LAQFLDYGREISGTAHRFLLAHSLLACALPRDRWQIASVATQLHAARLCSCQGGLVRAEMASFLARLPRPDVNREVVRSWHVDGDKLHAAVHQVGYESGRSGQAIEFGNHEGRAMQANRRPSPSPAVAGQNAGRSRLGELRRKASSDRPLR